MSVRTKFWRRVEPDLQQIREMEVAEVLAKARAASYTMPETVFLVCWMLGVYFLVQEVIKQSPHESKLAFSITTNLTITLPLMCFVFIPIYIRKMRRNIRAELVNRKSGQ